MGNNNYQFLDFTGISELDGSETLRGAFEKAKSGKPILVSNLMGLTFFSSDVNPADTTAAILPGIVVSEGSFTIIGVKVNSDDTVEAAS